MIDGFDSAHEPVVPLGDSGLVRLRLNIAYDGTEFSGWARQPGQRTVCGVLEDRLSSIFGAPLQLTVAGRTDAGVHASGQVAHVDVPVDRLPRIAPKSQSAPAPDSSLDMSQYSLSKNLGHLVRRLAKFLPSDVRVRSVTAVPPEFDARFSAFRRHYRYRFSTAAYGVDPLDARSVVSWPRSIDLPAMRIASTSLLGLHDFAAFCKRREGATTVRELQRFEWEVDGDRLTAHVSADAFCWSMVRSLVGAIQAVGDGRRTPEWTARLLDARARSSSVVVAPAHGLELVQVDYPSADHLAQRQRETREVRKTVESSLHEIGESCCGGDG